MKFDAFNQCMANIGKKATSNTQAYSANNVVILTTFRTKVVQRETGEYRIPSKGPGTPPPAKKNKIFKKNYVSPKTIVTCFRHEFDFPNHGGGEFRVGGRTVRAAVGRALLCTS